MNFEKLENISTPIEAENVLEREEKLNEKIKEISLVYAISRWEKVKQRIPDYKLSEALKFYSPTENFILRSVFDLDNFNFKENKEKIDQLLSVFYKQVDALSEADEIQPESILDLLNKQQATIITDLGLENFPKAEKKNNDNGTKIVQFNDLTNLDVAANGKFKSLIDEGFDKGDQLIEVHFKEFYQGDEKVLSPELIKKDLAYIAKQIVQEKPETAAVIGQSWLLDTAASEILGFKKIASEETKENDFSTWLQFVDKDGEVSKKRIDKLMKNGELPFKSTIAYINTEDFLKKYLPTELRGKVVLKELDQEKKEEIDILFKNNSALTEQWRSAITTDSFNSFISHETVKRLFDFIDAADKEKILEYYQRMFKEKTEDFTKYRTKEIDDAFNKMSQNIKKYTYSQEKEVIID